MPRFYENLLIRHWNYELSFSKLTVLTNKNFQSQTLLTTQISLIINWFRVVCKNRFDIMTSFVCLSPFEYRIWSWLDIWDSWSHELWCCCCCCCSAGWSPRSSSRWCPQRSRSRPRGWQSQVWRIKVDIWKKSSSL